MRPASRTALAAAVVAALLTQWLVFIYVLEERRPAYSSADGIVFAAQSIFPTVLAGFLLTRAWALVLPFAWLLLPVLPANCTTYSADFRGCTTYSLTFATETLAITTAFLGAGILARRATGRALAARRAATQPLATRR